MKRIILIIAIFICTILFVLSLYFSINGEPPLNEISMWLLAPTLTGIISFALAFFKHLRDKVTIPMVNIPGKNQHFTGRQEVLEKIQDTLKEKRAVVIPGLGGIGKTQVALEYAYRHKNKYKCICWINAETDETIAASYHTFAIMYKIIDKDTKETGIIIEAVRNWMQQHDNWLFIFDNVENEKTLETFLRAQNEGRRRHVLITSRNRQFLHFALLENFDVFTEREACDFIKEYTKKPADEHFKELAKKMGYLPLALAHVGAYIAIRQNSSYEKYLKSYNKKNLVLFTDSDDPKKITVATTWQISFDNIHNPASKQLLNLCAFFAPDNISTQWFVDASEVLPAPLQEVVTDDTDYDNAIVELTKYSLVTLKDGNLSIHRLVQDVIRDSLKEEQTEWRNYCTNILYKLRYFDFPTAESRKRFSDIVPHIISVTKEINDKDTTEEIALLYRFLGHGFAELADYSQALAWYEKALVIRERGLGNEHPDTAIIHNDIGMVYRKQENYDKALEYHEKALSFREKVLGNEHPDTAQSYNNIGLVYWKQGNYDRALEYFKKALVIQEKVLGNEHQDTATIYNNIGLVYRKQKKYDKALEYHEKALSFREKVLSNEHLDTAQSYNNIGYAYNDRGDCDRALKYYKKALGIHKKVLGDKHPNTKLTLNNMEIAYKASGKREPFEKWLKKN